jgi:predicted ATPase
MKSRLQSVSIEGFKSIRSLKDFSLNPGLNVLIGANGAGKSNFLNFFHLLKHMDERELDQYVKKMGRADSFFFQGASVTKEIKARLSLEFLEFSFTLLPTLDGSLIVESTRMSSVRRELSETCKPPDPSDVKNQALGAKFDDLKGVSAPPNPAVPYGSIGEFLELCQICDFRDTAPFSSLRKDASVCNDKKFLADGSNLPAFLLSLQKGESGVYRKIRTAVKLIMPGFDDFALEPEENEALNDKFVRLRWRQKGSGHLFQPWQMSDGSLRFLALSVALLQPNPPTLIVIDAPELSLHPESLATLAGFMHEAAYNSQLIVTTQSPDLLNAMEPEDVVTVNMRNGESIFERLNRADLADWLNDYTIGDLWWKKVIQAGPTSV